MAWVKSNPIQDKFSSLCVQNGDVFTINDNCLKILEEILKKLATEDCTLRTFRRAIGFGQNIRKHLIPILLYVKDNTKITNASKIIDTTIKILGNLTIPVEYLLSIEGMSRTDMGRHTIFEINRLLITSKEAFTDGRSTKAVVDHMKHIIENGSELNLDQCHSINNCLLLLTNILHIPENKTINSNTPLTNSSMQNQIIWNLFTQSIDKIIIYLLSCPQRMYWSVTMVQLIALMYKDQHVGTLQKLLNLWLEASYSDSSEDNESNTSPPDQGSDDSSPVVTSDPTSDSSDTGGNDRNKHSKGNNNCERRSSITDVVRVVQNKNKTLANMKRNKSTETETSTSSGISSMGHSLESNENEPQQFQLQLCNQNSTNKKISYMCQSSQSEISDCGYVTQIENQESISTSSNEDDQPQQKPVHQKPHSFQKSRYNGKFRVTTVLEKKELRRKKLVKRSKTNIINMKGLMHHLPTDDDISNILKEFTVDFLLKGYGTLIKELRTQLLTNIHIAIDTSHFFWLVTYFLKFATQLELDPEHISPVLSYDTLSYLVFQGVWVYEELEISCTIPDIDIKPCLRRLHLVVTALREFLQGLKTYQKMIHLSDNDKEYLTKLEEQICKAEDLKMLFVLLLKQYNPNIQSKQYLQDLIITNHNFLLFLDNKSKSQQNTMTEHLKHFASVEIMRQYGLLLENFKENGEFVNNCIFTMMHHIGGDLKNVPTLFQPSILKTFSKIWETDYEICDDWSDLIEYVIHKFINTPGTQYVNSSNAPISINRIQDTNEILSSENDSESEWTKEEKDNLLKYYNQSKKSCDTIANITKKYERNGLKQKSQLAVIKELLDQNIISFDEYNELIRSNTQIKKEQSTPASESCNKNFQESLLKDYKIHFESDIGILRDYLCKQNSKYLLLLQKLLIEVCFIKLVLSKVDEFTDVNHIMEPTVYYFVLLNLPVPVIPWTTEQSNIMKYQPFLLLLHKLGFYLPADTGKIFVQIPNFWTADYIFNVAQQLGPIDTGKLKFPINKLTGQNKYDQSENASSCCGYEKFSTMDLKQIPPIIRYTPLPNTSQWFQMTLHTKVAPLMNSASNMSSTSQLSIAIPDPETITFDIPPPELAIAGRTWANKDLTTSMECSPIYQQDVLLTDQIEKNSNCDTASVASDLTRMCVSDEEDKVILVIQKNDENS
ncbi:protein timeless isoform X2 [Anoplophora glabripennis]|uniref:protein timeless isoform X2 n=1 Tax=Anoplophora glabripennis TaxID=217634 RepID=UPI000873D247|nr:protein timeless isoform X2 [Anoplophora glabripennis]